MQHRYHFGSGKDNQLGMRHLETAQSVEGLASVSEAAQDYTTPASGVIEKHIHYPYDIAFPYENPPDHLGFLVLGMDSR